MDSRRVVLVVAAGVFVTAFAAAAPVLHEYFDVDGVAPANTGLADRGLAARNDPATAGQAPRDEGAAGPSVTGAAANRGQAADPSTPNDPAARSRAEANTASHQALAAVSDPDRYRLDANTSRPDNVSYSDPFTPAIPPFKRLYAFDAVNADLELVVSDPSLVALRIGGHVAAGDDQFMGDVSVQLTPGDLVRIPSVGPGARIVGFRLEPPAHATVLADSAENWFIRSSEGGAHQLLMHLVIDHAVFGSDFRNTGWEALAKALPNRPNIVFDSAEAVLRRIGVSQEKAPAQALAGLVEYFREFAPSDEVLSERGAALYERIALSQKGVCRHRAFAFVVTALALGLPSRFVHNEAHAWVEVYDGDLWHRIDLGGAAGHAGVDQPLPIQHVAPDDPFPWPPKSERGTDMLSRSLGAAGGGASAAGQGQETTREGAESTLATEPGVSASVNPQPVPAPSSSGSAAQLSGDPASFEPDTRDAEELTSDPALEPQAPGVASSEVALEAIPGEVKFEVSSKDVTRGSRIALHGKVGAPGVDCSMRRMNVVLRSKQGRVVPIGALFTDAQGRFNGEIVVAESVPLGDYDVQVVLDGRCARSVSGK